MSGGGVCTILIVAIDAKINSEKTANFGGIYNYVDSIVTSW